MGKLSWAAEREQMAIQRRLGEAVALLFSEDRARLEVDCGAAIALQDFDKLERLVIIYREPDYARGDFWRGAGAVASWVGDFILSMERP